MKYYARFDDETQDEGRSGGVMDEVGDLIDSISGFIGEDLAFEVYEFDTNRFVARYVWEGGVPVKSNIPRRFT